MIEVIDKYLGPGKRAQYLADTDRRIRSVNLHPNVDSMTDIQRRQLFNNMVNTPYANKDII